MTDIEIYESNLLSFEIKQRYGTKAQCRCPAHDDKHASLTITRGKKCTLFHCHAGCTIDDILAAAGLSKQDTFYDAEPRKANWKAYIESRENRKIEAVYNYVSINGGCYAFTKIRLQGKKMLYGILENERFAYGLRGQTRKDLKAIYGSLEALNRAVAEGKPIFIPEGEKGTDTLIKQGYTAFTYGGVNDWQKDFATLVQGAEVFIMADNDDAGKRVAETIQHDIKAVAKNCKIVIPMPGTPKADITDYFNAGHSKAEFEQIIKQEQSTVTKNRKEVAEHDTMAIKSKTDLDLAQFHHHNEKGTPTAVFDFAILEHIKNNYHIFVCGSPYLYQNGVYIADHRGTRIKNLIKQYLYPQFIKSRVINQIYTLVIEADELQKEFDTLNNFPAHWVNFKDCMLDLKTMGEIPHAPKYLAINQIPFSYKDIKVAGEGKETDKFFDFIFSASDDRQMLLEYAGLCLTKDTTQQKFMILCGQGGTGKSILIRMIEAMLGSENTSNVAMQELNRRFSTSLLTGRLLNSSADLSMEALEDSSIVKKLLGEDTLMSERKGENAFMFRNYSKLLFSTNMLPVVTAERTNGFFRRLLILKMDKQPEKPDTELFSRLEKEIPYFIRLAVEAVHGMYQRGLITVSENSKEAVIQMRKDSDVVESWLHDSCTIGKDLRVERVEAYQNFEKYCKDEERQPLTRTGFFKALRAKSFAEVRGKTERYFVGISVGKVTAKSDGFMEITQEELADLPFQ